MDDSVTISLSGKPHRIESQPVGQARTEAQPFLRFITRDRANRRLLIIALVGVLLQFIVFKILYPFPDFFSDSYSYIYAAYAHLDVSIWPIGYSKYLDYFHQITHSDTALIASQYFLLQLTSLYFFFTWLYFIRPKKTSRNIMFLFLFFTPLSLYISNYVSSDSLFAGLSLLWFTELLWVICRSRVYQIITQGVFLFLCFTVRNNAYYYPLVAALAFLLSNRHWVFKITGCLIGPLLILPFILHTRSAANKITGTGQYSLFTGWQIANNALYIYGNINVDSNTFVTQPLRELNHLSSNFYATVPKTFNIFLSSYPGGNFFLQYGGSPLKLYFASHYRSQGDIQQDIAAWGKASILFKEYGEKLIAENPFTFLHYFVFPNVKNYLIPPLEKLRVYNMGEAEVEPIAQDWFDFTTSEIKAPSATIQGRLLLLFPYLFTLTNFYLIFLSLSHLIKRETLFIPKDIRPTFFLVISLLIINLFFCITVTIIVFRYEFFPLIIYVAFSLVAPNSIEPELKKIKSSYTDTKNEKNISIRRTHKN